MIYLVSQATFIFLTQIYYSMNFITLSSNFITRFPWYFKINLCRLLLEGNFLAHKKCIFFNMPAKLVLRIRNFFKMPLKNFLQPANFSENTGPPQFFSKFFRQLYFKNINFLTKVNSELPDDWQISNKQYHIFQKSKSYEISNTDIYIGEDLEFTIHVFCWCIQLDHEIY